MYYLHCKEVHVTITKKRSVDLHFVRTCTIISILTFSLFSQSVSQKKTVKVIEDDIYGKLFEIYKETEKGCVS